MNVPKEGDAQVSLAERLLTALRFLGIDLVHSLGRTLLAITALAAVIASYLVIVAGADGFADFQPYFTSELPNIWLMSKDVLSPADSSISQAELETAARVVRAEFGADALRVVLPMIYRSMHDNGKTYALAAAPAEDLVEVFKFELVAGDWPAPGSSGKKEVAASSTFIQISGKQPGDTLAIFGTDFRIAGVVQSSGNMLALIWMDLGTGQALYSGRDDFQVGILALAKGVDPAAVQAKIEGEAALANCCSVYLDSELNETAAQQLATLEAILKTFQILALFVVTFGVYNAANLTMAERAHEIALLRVAGFTPGELQRLLAAHFLLFTLAAFLVGWGAAEAYTAWHSTAAYIVGQAITLKIQVRDLLVGLALTLGFALAGAWLPARTFFRRSTAEHLREL